MKFEKGIFNIFKPKGPSSYDIIRQVKRDSVDKKVGHGGTLDPLASGVLVVAVGREFTRQLETVARGEKEYEATIYLGKTSTTLDEEGEKTNIEVSRIPDLKDVENTLNKFKGKIKQTPPAYSALKVNGQRAYKLARQGKEVDIEAREVEILDINLINFTYPELTIRVSCSGGTYIRTLAKDVGEELKTGGYLKNLVRTRVGNFRIKDSIKLI